MGAGQIGGMATLLDIDFHNAAGFLGERVENTEGQHVVHFLSHAMMFCMGSLIEAHVVLTAASCVLGERYKFEVVAGTHRFLEYTGIGREVNHYCHHKAPVNNMTTRRSLSSIKKENTPTGEKITGHHTQRKLSQTENDSL